MRQFWWFSIILILCFAGREVLVNLAKAHELPLPNSTAPREGPFIIHKPAKTLPGLNQDQKQQLLAFVQSRTSNPGDLDQGSWIQKIYQQMGITMPYNFTELSLMGRSIEQKDADIGDLLFFSGTEQGNSQIQFVALVLQKTDDQLILMYMDQGKLREADFFQSAHLQAQYLSTRRPSVNPT